MTDDQRVFPSGLIMAGGRGSRLGFIEKGMIKIGGKTLLEMIFTALSKTVHSIYLCGSLNSPGANKFAHSHGINFIMGSGRSYTEDLMKSLGLIEDYPVIVLPSDAYFSDEEAILEIALLSAGSKGELVNIISEGNETGISVFKAKPVGSETLSYADLHIRSRIVNINTREQLLKLIRINQ
ncbi:NTP transferase domain-containing protein [Thermoplasmatales archaeon AK]|nr:NTP transferase domain-containing protein [Thermoplasmatales archaeon AK]